MLLMPRDCYTVTSSFTLLLQARFQISPPNSSLSSQEDYQSFWHIPHSSPCSFWLPDGTASIYADILVVSADPALPALAASAIRSRSTYSIPNANCICWFPTWDVWCGHFCNTLLLWCSYRNLFLVQILISCHYCKITNIFIFIFKFY